MPVSVAETNSSFGKTLAKILDHVQLGVILVICVIGRLVVFCQEVQRLYLKRKGLKNGTRYWSVITYGKYDESNNRTYSIEIEQCEENDVPDMLDPFLRHI